MAFAGTGKIWMNGKMVDWADAKIHVASHVIHYGSGVFEGARMYDTPKGSAILRLDALRGQQREQEDHGGPSNSTTLETPRVTTLTPSGFRGSDP